MSVGVCRSSGSSLSRLLRRLGSPGSPSVSNRVGISTTTTTTTTAAAAAEDKIVIPNKIHRSSTDVLKALAGTVGRDTTGPHYRYQDDPFLTPCSNLTKRSYALSKESGRKAARWIRDEHPTLFTHRPDDPFVESFYPKTQYGEDESDSSGGSKVSAETLVHLVGQGQVADAITVYHLCKKKGVELSEDVLQSVLEMVCFYNSEEPLDRGWVEERWFRQATATIKKTWKDQGLAQEVFAALAHRGSPAYCALIRGMALYYQVDRAWQLYQECREKAIALDTGTYNALIRVASLLRDAADLRWQLVKELLSAMAENNVSPNLGTMNATLEALTHVAGWRKARELSLQVMAEFNKQGVQPSLATYYYLLTIHCRDRGPISNILLDILDAVEMCHFTIQHPMDTHFFVTAMQTARTHLKSVEAARRIDAFLNQGNNYRLIGDSYKESVYYRHFFALSCMSLPFDEFMEVYRELVPHVYTPEPGVMQEVLQAVRFSGSLHHLPQLWSDMILFDLALREKLLPLILTALTEHHPDTHTQQEEGLTERLLTVTKDIWTRVQGQDPNRRNRLTWTGQMLGDLLEVLVRCGDYSTAVEVLREAATNPHTILGFLPQPPLATLLVAAIEKGDGATAVKIVLYGQDAGHMEAGQMALQVRSSLTLTPQQRAQVTSLLGHDTLLPPSPPPAEPPTPTPGT